MKKKKRRTFQSKAIKFIDKNNNGLEKWIPLTRKYGDNSLEEAVFGSKTNGKTGGQIKLMVHPLKQFYLIMRGQKLMTRLAYHKRKEVGFVKLERGGDETSALEYDQRKTDMAKSYTLAAHRDVDRSIEIYKNNRDFLILKTQMPIVPQIRYDRRPLITD